MNDFLNAMIDAGLEIDPDDLNLRAARRVLELEMERDRYLDALQVIAEEALHCAHRKLPVDLLWLRRTCSDALSRTQQTETP